MKSSVPKMKHELVSAQVLMCSADNGAGEMVYGFLLPPLSWPSYSRASGRELWQKLMWAPVTEPWIYLRSNGDTATEIVNHAETALLPAACQSVSLAFNTELLLSYFRPPGSILVTSASKDENFCGVTDAGHNHH
jgi:hypothetical protein